MTPEELQFLNKVSSQITSYNKLGFNQYGVRVSVKSVPLGDPLENAIRGTGIAGLSGNLRLNSAKGRIEIWAEDGNMSILIGNDQ